MNEREIKRLAQLAGVEPSKIAHWHFKFSHLFRTHKRFERPPGMLSVTEISSRYGIAPPLLIEWRKAGLPSRRGPGKLVLIKETDLQKWIAKVRWTRRPLGRPRIKGRD